MSNLAKHYFDSYTDACKWCGWTSLEAAQSDLPMSCMTDRDIEWTKKQAGKMLAHQLKRSASKI